MCHQTPFSLPGGEFPTCGCRAIKWDLRRLKASNSAHTRSHINLLLVKSVFIWGGRGRGHLFDMKAMICVYFDGKKCRAVREKINFISMHQPNAGDEGVMRGWNVYERVGASVVVVKDCIGSAIMHK